MTEQAAGKFDKAAKSSPQALKRNAFSMTNVTSKLVPFSNPPESGFFRTL
jgi:hypothetical protein